MAVRIKPPEDEAATGRDKGCHRETNHAAGMAATAPCVSLDDDADRSQSAHSEFEDEGGSGEEEQYSEFEDDDEVRRKEMCVRRQSQGEGDVYEMTGEYGGSSGYTA